MTTIVIFVTKNIVNVLIFFEEIFSYFVFMLAIPKLISIFAIKFCDFWSQFFSFNQDNCLVKSASYNDTVQI